MRRILLALVTFVMVFALACRPTQHPHQGVTYTDNPPSDHSTIRVPTWVDAAFTPEMNDQIYLALTDWNRALNGYLEFQPRDAFDFDGGVDTRNEYLEKFGAVGLAMGIRPVSWQDPAMEPGVLGFWDEDDPAYINIVTDRLSPDPEGMRRVVMHEIGHYLGLKHFPNRQGTLMFPYWWGQPDCIDHWTIINLAVEHAGNGMDDAHLNWCMP